MDSVALVEAETLGNMRWNGKEAARLANTLNVTIGGLHAEDFLIGLDMEGLAVSSGSACLVGSVQASHVLQAMNAANPRENFDQNDQATVRISIGPEIKDSYLEEIFQRMKRIIDRQRGMR